MLQELRVLLSSPRYHRSYLRGAGFPQASERNRDDWHNREYARKNRRHRGVAEAAEKSEDK